MIGSVQKAMNILTVISDGQASPVSLGRIAQETGYSKPTCSHILQTLCADGFAEKVSRSAGYVLGPATFVLTRYGRYGKEWISICRPVLQMMEKQVGVPIILSTVYSGKRFVVDAADSAHKIFRNHENIKTGKLYSTVTGRAILAQMDLESLEEIYQKNGAPLPEEWEGVSDFEQMLKELAALRREEIVAMKRKGGEISIAKPIFKDVECVGAVGFTYSFQSDEHSAQMRRVLLRGSKEIQHRLNYK